jgi:hypothetical protein
MSDVAPENIWRKLRYTPAKDLVRGRISGRLDVKGTIARSGLPAPAKDLIQRVVKRTRLWLSEKVDLADELIAHFLDGIEGGASVESLIEKFGDERKAAKLIRRAKKRNRPLPWHIMRALGWMMALMLAIYGFLAARFVLGRPSPKIDYVAALNKPVLSVPEDQRAWPIYRQAILGIGEREKKDAVNRLNEIFDARPGTEHWPKVGPWLKEHEGVVELTRQGSQKPIVGFILGHDGSMRDRQVFPDRWNLPASKEEGTVLTILLPHLSELRLLATILVVDATYARQQQDARRAMMDLEALLNMPPQMHRDSGLLILDMVSFGLWELGLSTMEQALLDQNLKLSDADLQKLAHLISRPKLPSDLVDFEGERMMVLDVVQRSYTDEGNGKGHLTAEGQKFLRICGAIAGSPRRASSSIKGYSEVLFECFTWASGPLTDSRETFVRKYERLMDIADANLRRPMREANWQPFDNAIYGWDPIDKVREPALALIVSLSSVQQRAEMVLGHRDGIVLRIALELYRRKNGQYPKTLGQLVPEYLPQVPADRISGGEVKYKLLKGRPLIYSVGADQDDDGGRPPTGKNGWIKAVSWRESKEKAADGDWLLFPQQEDERSR